MHHHGVELALQAQRAHVARQVLAVRVERLRQRQHPGREVGQRAAEVALHEEGVAAGASAQLQQRSAARRARALQRGDVRGRLVRVIGDRIEQAVPRRQLPVQQRLHAPKASARSAASFSKRRGYNRGRCPTSPSPCKPSLAACASLLAASAIAVPAVAQIADADPTGIEVGARVGYGRALGSRVAGSPLEDTWDGAWPLALDVGYRLTPHLYLGGTLTYMPLQLDKSAPRVQHAVRRRSGDCSGSAVRLAFDAQWLVARSWYATWIAGGFGVERMRIDYRSGCFDGPFSTVEPAWNSVTSKSASACALQPGLVIGPFVQYDAGMFLASTTSGSCRSVGSDIPDKAVHGTVLWGLRVMYTVR